MSENIVVFRPENEFPLHRRRAPQRCACAEIRSGYSSRPAASIFVCEHTRKLECQKCGAIIEPFDYLWQVATEGEGLVDDIKHMREEKATLKAQLQLLNDELKELRAITRKAQRSA